MSKLARLSLLSLLCTSLAACGEEATGPGNEEEVISRVELVLTPMAGGGTALTAAFDDPDGDGGAPPTVDTLSLTAGTTYATSVRFLNALETPAEDITIEVRDESAAHQVFFTGTGVDGPASDQPGAAVTHAYTDTDVNGLPVGLENTLTAVAGTGELIVTLRHLPPINETPVKTAALAEAVRLSGFSGLPGATDVQVTFPVEVPVR